MSSLSGNHRLRLIGGGSGVLEAAVIAVGTVVLQAKPNGESLLLFVDD